MGCERGVDLGTPASHPPCTVVWQARAVRASHRLACAATCLMLASCFSYIPAELETVPAGREVRVYLTRPAMAQLPEEIPASSAYLAGSLITQERDSLMVRVPVTARAQTAAGMTLRQDVRIPTREIVELRRRELNTTATALAVAGTVGAAAAIVFMIIDTHGATRRTPGEPPVLIRIPVFSAGSR